MSALATYQVVTHNPSSASENRMHSDDVARQFGFKGGLVPGVTVFAHMTQPLAAHYGEAWLSRGTADVRFSKPAYEGELLSINTADDGDGSHVLTCLNAQGVELARMSASMQAQSALPDPRGEIAPAPPLPERPTVSWDLMEIGTPFPALPWTPTREENITWCNESRDTLALYQDGAAPLLHPGLILRQANFVLRKRFIIPAWIHAASRIRFSSHCGSALPTKCVPYPKKNGTTRVTNLCGCTLPYAAVSAPWQKWRTRRYSARVLSETPNTRATYDGR